MEPQLEHIVVIGKFDDGKCRQILIGDIGECDLFPMIDGLYGYGPVIAVPNSVIFITDESTNIQDVVE